MGTKTISELKPGTPAGSSTEPSAAVCPVDPALSRYFDETVEYWDQIYTGQKFVNWHLAERKELVIDAVRRLSLGRSLKVLDLGSGSGVLTRDLLKMGHSVVALDCSEKMVRTLKQSLQGHPKFRLIGAVVGSAGQVGFRSGTFDLILCIGVIQYERQPELIFNEVSRLLKPGAACVFSVPNQLSLHHLLDPWCLARYFYRVIVLHFRHGASWSKSCRSAVDRPSRPDEIYEKRYLAREILALVKTQPLIIRKAIGFGYGPLTVFNKPVLPDKASIALSKALTKLLRLRALSGWSILANRWVVIAEKQ